MLPLYNFKLFYYLGLAYQIIILMSQFQQIQCQKTVYQEPISSHNHDTNGISNIVTSNTPSYHEKHTNFVKSYIHWVSVVKKPKEWSETFFASNGSFQVGNFHASYG